jgi:hypothetical protein
VDSRHNYCSIHIIHGKVGKNIIVYIKLRLIISLLCYIGERILMWRLSLLLPFDFAFLLISLFVKFSRAFAYVFVNYFYVCTILLSLFFTSRLLQRKRSPLQRKRSLRVVKYERRAYRVWVVTSSCYRTLHEALTRSYEMCKRSVCWGLCFVPIYATRSHELGPCPL